MDEGTLLESYMATRRSVRRFADRPVDREVLEAILLCACTAPSAHNAQPWRFAVLTSQHNRLSLAEAMAADFRRDLALDGVPPDGISARVAQSIAMIAEAPVALVLCLTMVDMHRYPDRMRAEAEAVLAIQSTALAGGQVLLAAHARGLGAVWLCAPRFCPATVQCVLDLPADWEPQALILIGYAQEGEGGPKLRKPLTDVVKWDTEP